jgi:hypothetical protein
VVQVEGAYGAGGRTPGTALHGNMRTPATGARQTPASNSGHPAQNPLNTVAAATTRPSRFMQGAARGGLPAGQQAAPDDTPAVPARPAGDVGTDASNKGPSSGETSAPPCLAGSEVRSYQASEAFCDRNASQTLNAVAIVIMAMC